jgi:hypothetical protein
MCRITRALGLIGADITSVFGTERTWRDVRLESAMRIKADLQDGARMFCSERTNRGYFQSFSQKEIIGKQKATQALLRVSSRKTVPLGPPEILSWVHSVQVGERVYGVSKFTHRSDETEPDRNWSMRSRRHE